MKLLPILLTSLLLAVPAWGQQRGMVDKMNITDLPTCSADTPELFGYRVYDTSTNQEKTCNETAVGWVITEPGNSGGLNITAVTASETPTVTELTQDCFKAVYTNTGDADGADMTLPNILGAYVGMCVTFTSTVAQVFCIDTAASDDLALGLVGGGALIGVGDSIDSSGSVGDTITLMATGTNMWSTIASVGAWSDGGAACP